MIAWFGKISTIAVLTLSVTFAHAASPDKPQKDPEQAFKRRDKDGNGKLTLEEFVGKRSGDKAAAAETRFKTKDKDGDGSLTLEEFRGRKQSL